MKETFTIVSTGASLVEVDGDGPATDLPGGLAVADGVPTIAPVDLLTGFERFFRVDAGPSVTAKVNVSESPFGALLTVRRCETSAKSLVPTNGVIHRHVDAFDPAAFVPVAIREAARILWHLPVKDAVNVIVQATPFMVAAFNALSDGLAGAAPCPWSDVAEKSVGAVDVRGGDIVVVSFVVP